MSGAFFSRPFCGDPSDLPPPPRTGRRPAIPDRKRAGERYADAVPTVRPHGHRPDGVQQPNDGRFVGAAWAGVCASVRALRVSKATADHWKSWVFVPLALWGRLARPGRWGALGLRMAGLPSMPCDARRWACGGICKDCSADHRGRFFDLDKIDVDKFGSAPSSQIFLSILRMPCAKVCAPDAGCGGGGFRSAACSVNAQRRDETRCQRTCSL